MGTFDLREKWRRVKAQKASPASRVPASPPRKCAGVRLVVPAEASARHRSRFSKCATFPRVTDELAELQGRVNALAPDAWEEQVSLNEAILRLQAGDLVAARRLALALVKLGEFDRAEEVVEEALVLHPADDVLMRRADDIGRGRRIAAAEARTGSSVERAPSTWIKAVHYDGGGWTESKGTDLWMSDPGQRDASGERLYTAGGEPWGQPSWRVGEEAGIYFGGTGRVPFLVELIRPPEFNPSFVQAANWAQRGDGERWPWVTWVRVLRSVPVEAAPTLGQLGIQTASMQQRARLLTDPDIHHRLRKALGLT